MFHYEILFMVHPDQSDQVASMIDRFRTMVEEEQGTIHRQENWGRRQLTFSINKVHKAHYVLMNIECTKVVIEKIQENFRFNDAILRFLLFREKVARTEMSPIYKEVLTEDGRLEEVLAQQAGTVAAAAADTTTTEDAS